MLFRSGPDPRESGKCNRRASRLGRLGGISGAGSRWPRGYFKGLRSFSRRTVSVTRYTPAKKKLSTAESCTQIFSLNSEVQRPINSFLRTVAERVETSTAAARVQSKVKVKKNMELNSYLMLGMSASIWEMMIGSWSLSST